MPTYQYRCTACGAELEVVQKFTDPALTVCPECEGELRKLYNAVGVVFKGSGFYRTDSRKESGAGSSSKDTTKAAGTSEGSGSKESGGASSAGKDAASTTPAAKKSDSGSTSS